MRSSWAENVSTFVKALLDCEKQQPREVFATLAGPYCAKTRAVQACQTAHPGVARPLLCDFPRDLPCDLPCDWRGCGSRLWPRAWLRRSVPAHLSGDLSGFGVK